MFPFMVVMLSGGRMTPGASVPIEVKASLLDGYEFEGAGSANRFSPAANQGGLASADDGTQTVAKDGF